MTIGIIGAMREEVDSIRSDLMKNVRETIIGGRTYYGGQLMIRLLFSYFLTGEKWYLQHRQQH